MAQIKTYAVGAAGWTQLDNLAGHTLIEVLNKDQSQSLGLKIAATDPGAGVAWDSADTYRVDPGGSPGLWRIATSDKVWGRTSSGTQGAGAETSVYESV